jgi:hypothetical protein
MKNLILYFLIFLAIQAEGQTVPSSCTAPDSIAKRYSTDAKRLAIRRTYKINSTFKDSVKIEPNLTNSYLKALLAIYNATLLPSRDTVVYFQIHTAYPDMNTFLITGDTSASWMHDFKNNIFPTSNSTINNLVTQYALQKVNYTTLSNTQGYHLVSFITDSCWNLYALSQKFMSIQGVLGAGSNVFPLDAGADIFDSINPNFIQLTYRVKWGDCLAGCIYHHDWVFKVYSDCSVEFVGSFGNAITWQLFIGMEENEKNELIKIYPNPVFDVLKLETKQKIHRISILNCLGEIVKQQSLAESVDLSNLERGIYFLEVQTGAKTQLFKILKE